MTSRLGMATLALLASCTESSSPPTGGTHVGYMDIPVTPNRDVDVLFIFDDSSALELQTNVKANFPTFIDVLNTTEGGLPNLHLGVVTSDLGTKGAEDAVPGPSFGSGPGSCAGDGKSGNLQTNGTALVSGSFVSDVKNTDGTRSKNYMGTLADAFSAIASVGGSGCGFEQPIEAAKRALNNNLANAGFLRVDAYLAMVFVLDEDDCSMARSTLLSPDTAALGPLQSFRCNRFGHVCTDGGADSTAMNTPGVKGGCTSNESSPYLTKVGDYGAFFKGLKSDPANVIVAAIAGPATPYSVELRTPPGGGTAIPAIAHSCSYVGGMGQPGAANPAVRMRDLVDLFPRRNAYATACQQDLSPALTQIAQLIRLAIGTPCFDTMPADVDPTTPGPQYDCSVSDVRNRGRANETETVLPRCNNTVSPAASTNQPCWSIQTDMANCTTAPHLTLKVERTEVPDPDTHVIAYCVLEN